jgi:hypothetical protein
VSVSRDHYSRDVNTLGAQRVEFVEQDGGVDHNTITNDWRDVRIQNSRRYKLEGESLALYDNSVTGIVPTLVSDYEVHIASEKVGQFTLTFIAPLSSHYNSCGHVVSSIDETQY